MSAGPCLCGDPYCPRCGDPEAITWGARAESLLKQALSEVRDGIDAIPTVSAALTALRIEAGELPESEMAGEEAVCICPPDLLKRGGFRGTCPEHKQAAKENAR